MPADIPAIAGNKGHAPIRALSAVHPAAAPARDRVRRIRRCARAARCSPSSKRSVCRSCPRQARPCRAPCRPAAFLAHAARVLLERDRRRRRRNAGVLAGARRSSGRTRLARALCARHRERFADVKARAGRFDEPGARYVLRAFVRVKPDGGCPARTVWSDYSEPFVDRAVVRRRRARRRCRFRCPDVDRSRSAKSSSPTSPSCVPAALQNLLGGNPKDLMEGKGASGGASDSAGSALQHPDHHASARSSC